MLRGQHCVSPRAAGRSQGRDVLRHQWLLRSGRAVRALVPSGSKLRLPPAAGFRIPVHSYLPPSRTLAADTSRRSRFITKICRTHTSIHSRACRTCQHVPAPPRRGSTATCLGPSGSGSLHGSSQCFAQRFVPRRSRRLEKAADAEFGAHWFHQWALICCHRSRDRAVADARSTVGQLGSHRNIASCDRRRQQ